VVYPYAISGGWNVIGRTPLAVFDASRQEPSLFAPGDQVRFRPISREEFSKMQG
jgi:allophanate hydrolase subunit 1